MDKEKRYTVVFAGDSTTDADKLLTGDQLGNGYVREVHSRLTAFEPQNRYTVFNAGVSGNTSRDLLARWDTDVCAHTPDVAFCMIGINDIWRQFDYGAAGVLPDEFERNIRAVCEKGVGGGRLIWMTPYFMERNRADEMRQMTERYGAIVKKTAEEYGMTCLDMQAEFDVYMRYRPGQSICWDRVHPGLIGAQIIAEKVLQTLKSVL